MLRNVKVYHRGEDGKLAVTDVGLADGYNHAIWAVRCEVYGDSEKWFDGAKKPVMALVQK